MEKACRILFNLYPGEWRKASLFIVLCLLWSIGGYGIFTLSEGLFLEQVGAESLPQAYLGIATSMCLLSAVLIFLLNRLSIRYLLFCVIGFWSITHFVFLTFLPSSSPLFWFFFKVAGWMVPISTYIVYWAFVDQYFDLQDAKRFFCIFNAVTFLGDSIGGGMISFCLKPLGAQGLLLIYIACLVSSIPFIFLINQKISPVLEEHADSVDTSTKQPLSHLIRNILRSKFTLYLLGFYFLMQVLAIVTEFNYMESFDKTFAHRGDHALTEFIGICGMWISLINMFFGILLYSRMVKKMGIQNIIIVAPAFFLTVFIIWNCIEALPIAVFGMIAREGMVYSFDDNNLNLLISGVPTKVKNQVRISVESFFEPIGMFCGAFLLLFFHQKGHLLGLILSLTAFLAVFFLRSHYAQAIFSNLVSSVLSFEKKATDWIAQFSKNERKKTEYTLFLILKKGKESEQLLAYKLLIQMQNKKVLPHLLNHLSKLSLPGKLHVIELFKKSAWAQQPTVLEKLKQLGHISAHPPLKRAIHIYFATTGLMHPEKVMHDLHSDDIELKLAAILTLKTSPYGRQFPSFYALASTKLSELLESNIVKEIAAGLDILIIEGNPEQISSIFSYFSHPNTHIHQKAAHALAQMANPNHKGYAPQIVRILSTTKNAQVRFSCLLALEKIEDASSISSLISAASYFHPNEHQQIENIALSIKTSIAPSLITLVKMKELSKPCRLLAGKILGKIDRKLLQKHLFELVQSEMQHAFFYFFHAHEIQSQVPEYDLSVLEDTLHAGYRSSLDFIIQILGIAGSIKQSDVLSYTLHSKNQKVRAQAIESLEKACDRKTFNLLKPLLDEQETEEKLDDYLKKEGSPYTLSQLLNTLERSCSRTDRIVAISLKARLNMVAKS